MPYFPLGKTTTLSEYDLIIHLGGNVTCKHGKPVYPKGPVESGTEVIYRRGKFVGAIKKGVPQWMVRGFYPQFTNVVEIRDLTDDEEAEAKRKFDNMEMRFADKR